MRRRDVLKGMAAAVGVATVGAEATVAKADFINEGVRPDDIVYEVPPDWEPEFQLWSLWLPLEPGDTEVTWVHEGSAGWPDSKMVQKFKACFEPLIESGNWAPIENCNIEVEFLENDAKRWLGIDDDPLWLPTEEVWENRRFVLINRAMDLRLGQYRRSLWVYGQPVIEPGITRYPDADKKWPNWAALKAWNQERRALIKRVRVSVMLRRVG